MNTENLEIGKKYEIHSYKHDGKIHRAWDEAVLLEIHKDYLIFGNEKTKVTESDGRTWHTKEPAVLYFFYNRWYNIIGQYKKTGIYYYCNLASPFILEEDTIKYIDYDLDLRVFPDGSFKVLDRGEYKYHKELMNYPESIDKILKLELTNLINSVRKKESAFSNGTVEHYCGLYSRLKRKKMKHIKQKNSNKCFFFAKTQKNIKKAKKNEKSIYKNKLMYIILEERGNMS